MKTGPGLQHILVAGAILAFGAATGCRSAPTLADEPPVAHSSLMNVSVPPEVRRLAVWYPRTIERDVAYAYAKLEQATVHLKKQRSWIQIVERRSMEPLTNEQRFQVSGAIADESAVRLGRWIGADAMVLFQIDVPTWRERLLARFHGTMPPLAVSSKVVSVESGEVLYYDLVTTMPVPRSGGWSDYASDYDLQPPLSLALEQALSLAIAHLHQSFQ